MHRTDLKTIRFAFIQSIPVLLGYLFIGIAYGLLLQQAGFNFFWALLTSVFIYAGSLQFILITFLSSGTALPTVLLMTLFVNSRHLFYGLSFVERFRHMGWRYPYMVFSLTDETYSVFCSLKAPEGIDEDNARFWVAVFDQGYWVIGSVLGSLIGQVIPIDFAGIEFSMTALFMVIFLEQWKTARSHLPALIGLASGLIFLLILGSDRFLFPSLLVTVAALILAKPFILVQHEKQGVDPI